VLNIVLNDCECMCKMPFTFLKDCENEETIDYNNKNSVLINVVSTKSDKSRTG